MGNEHNESSEENIDLKFCFITSKLRIVNCQAQSMAQLNMLGNHWNGGSQGGWHGNNYNGSNMSLNMPNAGFMPNDHQMWNPWMQPQQYPQYPYPMMPGGKTECKRMSENIQTFLLNRNSTASFEGCFAIIERAFTTLNDER